ncbi:MAG: hypothetical protein ACKOXB_06735 [Flavobacteriales bacterium]
MMRGVFISFFFLLFAGLNAQDSLYYETEAAPLPPVKQHNFSDKKWESLRDELDYSQGKKKEEKKEEEPKGRQSDKSSFSPPSMWMPGAFAMKVIFWSILGVVIIVLIIVFVRNWKVSPTNRKIKIEKGEVSDFIPENIAELDLRGMLDELRSSASYREAIRAYYLMVLRDLNDRKLIVLKKNSISREFLLAMHGQPLYAKFFTLTRLFEKVWYGDYDIEAHEFPLAADMFEEFIIAINTSGK